MLVTTFIEKYVKLIASSPNDVVVTEEKKDDSYVNVTIFVHPSDIGMIVGKNANMIKAINTYIGVYFVKQKISYRAYVKSIQELPVTG